MTLLNLENLTRRYPSASQAAVDDLSFTMQAGEILALVGPSGCGKTTTLRLVAGHERPDAGVIRLAGRVLASTDEFVPPERRQVGIVFQEHALFPHLSVYHNVAFGLARSSPAEQRARVMEMLHLVGMPGLAKRYPHQLSGGERQRVALARALAPRPALLLLDEPFSSLDADLRREVREQVRLILKALQVSALFVTHDQEEALYMGDRLAVLNAGRLEQIGTPEQVFHHAATRFVAGFMGNSDFLPGQLVPGGVQTGAGLLSQPVRANGSGQVEIALRGDDLDFASAEAGNGNGRILGRQFLGAWNLYRLELDSGQVLHAFKEHTCLLPVGERVQVSLTPGHRLVVFQDGKVVG